MPFTLRLSALRYNTKHSNRRLNLLIAKTTYYNILELNMNSSSSGSLSSVPNGRIIDFEVAELRKLPFQDSLYLWVRGSLPSADFEAKLAPRIYHDRPDYWGIEVAVVAMPRSDNEQSVVSTSLNFERSVPLTGITGSRGITVIGANQIKQIDISGESF